MSNSQLPTILLASLLVSAGPDARAASRCDAARLKTTGIASWESLRCHATAARRGAGVDASCVLRARTRFAARFASAGSLGDCAPNAEPAAPIDSALGAFVDAITSALSGSPEGSLLTTDAARRCGAAKMRLVARASLGKLRCFAVASAGGSSVDATCVGSQDATFSAKWSMVESRGGCATTNDADTVGTTIATVVRRAVGLITPVCGDGVSAGGEQCDGDDAATCPGHCNSDCTCSVCGDHTVGAGEGCDPPHDEACPASCRADCTCSNPPPTSLCCEWTDTLACCTYMPDGTVTCVGGTPGVGPEYCFPNDYCWDIGNGGAICGL